MNRKQLILVFLALAVLGGASLVLLKRNHRSWSEPQGKMGQKLFPNFPLNDVASLYLKSQGELHLVRKGGMWRVQERGDYPANFSQIGELMVKLAGLKISQSEPIGRSQLAHMELEPPGKGAGSGTLLELKDEQGKMIQSMILGKKHVEQSSRPSPYGGGEYPDGRYVMLADDSKNLLLISDPLSNLEPNAEPWLNRDFFKIEKPQSISLVSTNATNSWKLTRETETAPWVLADAGPGETLDSNKVSSIAGTLSYPSFVDVASNAAPAQTGLDTPLLVTISTFDHFTYNLKIGRKTAEDNYDLSVAVAADFPTERTPGKEEKAEDKQKLDKEFQAHTKTLQDKLNQEKSLAQWVYVVNSGLVDPLIRDRAQLLVEKKEEKPADNPAAAAPDATLDASPTAPGAPPTIESPK